MACSNCYHCRELDELKAGLRSAGMPAAPPSPAAREALGFDPLRGGSYATAADVEAVIGAARETTHWKLHLPVTDRDALGPERTVQLTNAVRRIEHNRDALEWRLRKMFIHEPIAVDAPCFACESAPLHKPECIYRDDLPIESVISSNRDPVEVAMMRVVSVLVSDWEHEPYPGTFRHTTACPICDLWDAMKKAGR